MKRAVIPYIQSGSMPGGYSFCDLRHAGIGVFKQCLKARAPFIEAGAAVNKRLPVPAAAAAAEEVPLAGAALFVNIE